MQNNESKKEFNQKEYINSYIKSHYKQFGVKFQPDQYNIVSEYCKDVKISQNKYMIAAALYCIDNAIDIDELLSHLK